jgi:hypothetical protein
MVTDEVFVPHALLAAENMGAKLVSVGTWHAT